MTTYLGTIGIYRRVIIIDMRLIVQHVIDHHVIMHAPNFVQSSGVIGRLTQMRVREIWVARCSNAFDRIFGIFV
jgi:hypothetical protein